MPGSQTGRAPISASAWAMSSPPVRMFDGAPGGQRRSARGQSPWSWKWRASQRARPSAGRAPGGWASARARVSTAIEIAPGGQHVEAGRASARRTARRHEAPVEAGEQRVASRAPPQAARAGRSAAVDPAEHGARCAVQAAVAGRALARHEARRQRARAARPCRRRCATAFRRCASEHLRPRPVQGCAPARTPADRSRGRGRRPARGCSDCVAGRASDARHARERHQQVGQLRRPAARVPKTCRPSRICISFRSQR